MYLLYCPPNYKLLKWNCWKFWSREMKYHHSSVVESKSFHHSWLGFASSLVMKWFWFNSRLVMIFHFSTPEFSAIVHFSLCGNRAGNHFVNHICYCIIFPFLSTVHSLYIYYIVYMHEKHGTRGSSTATYFVGILGDWFLASWALVATI